MGASESIVQKRSQYPCADADERSINKKKKKDEKKKEKNLFFIIFILVSTWMHQCMEHYSPFLANGFSTIYTFFKTRISKAWSLTVSQKSVQKLLINVCKNARINIKWLKTILVFFLDPTMIPKMKWWSCQVYLYVTNDCHRFPIQATLTSYKSIKAVGQLQNQRGGNMKTRYHGKRVSALYWILHRSNNRTEKTLCSIYVSWVSMHKKTPIPPVMRIVSLCISSCEKSMYEFFMQQILSYFQPFLLLTFTSFTSKMGVSIPVPCI